MKLLRILFISVLVVLFTACGSGGGGSSNDTGDQTPTTITGKFIDSAVAGLDYRCSSGDTGVTNTLGEYTCNEGDTVTFSIAGITLGSVTAQETITPKTLFPNNEEAALNLAQLLQTLDTDKDPNNGITLDSSLTSQLSSQTLDFNANDFDSNLETLLGISIVSESDAGQHLNATLVGLSQDPVNFDPVFTADTTPGNSDFTDNSGVGRATSASNFTYSNSGITFNSAQTASWFDLSNATNVEGNSLSATVKTDGTKGSVSISAHDFTYTPNTDQEGIDTFELTISDGSLSVDIMVTIENIDTTAPVLIFTGTSPINVTINTTYIDAGANATDGIDGVLSITTTGTVDTSTIGTYTLTYSATDSAGNEGNVSRTVNVIPPIFQSGETWKGLVYETVTSHHTGRVWLDRNLGASQVCTALDDTACYGDYYQWGRNADGHESSTSSTTNTQATDIDNVGDSFIMSQGSPYDWTSIDSDGSLRQAKWSKIDGTSVCPVGYRVPTEAELKAETINAGVSNSNTAFNSFLKLPSATYRFGHFTGGAVIQGGYIWSSTPTNDNYSAYGSTLKFEIFSNVTSMTGMWRADGCSIRCIKD
jgi:uncharacterized protein (TIGR02145 family)